ncbi:MAG: DUF2914 domain-containing protein [bacterium]|nr:DUF2914 domain-containing protein [bacterium]
MSSDRIRGFKDWYIRHERRISSGALLFGFIFDNLTLKRIDLLYENIVLASYLIIAALSITLVNLYETGKIRGRFFSWIYEVLPLILQFSFGALFSGFFVFYSRSGTVAGSWVFLVIILGLLVGNEFLRRRYLRLTFQVAVLFLALFSYAIFFTPVLLGKMGVGVFILSGIISIVAIYVFLRLLAFLMPNRIAPMRPILTAVIAGIFSLVNLLYFGNVIPPIPLSLKHADVYHNVTKLPDGNYELTKENQKWYERFRRYDTFHWQEGESVYVFSAVFAPTRLQTDIAHNWQYFDEQTKEWKSVNKIKFPIVGGRDGGYRGYSYKQNIFAGRWRVDIETLRGALIGRVKFQVVESDERPEFEKVIQ